ncbi:hypothetical protein O4160_13285 [Rhodococcus sp. IEGM 1401]|uniref:Eco57I restriction-modification methylase domain-containing protein n=1 Tax=unclassified Rhodococcus (in: high G+C Gram-positive bacteria) TaxID=192944 RepID=UPI0022B2C83A|nr:MULTISPECIES: hypothetical protein [unclassified Rhodococcus (in: high G+C Gram-positive bacteria)]MCZ4561810.1 hypothetical protein [Rhodococcus sp. IEGM 1401]MDI9922013.1 hypothetical protein [Rhodococcus sp. IEGM 1372]MDV8034404.1 hypothetical protein [Rhodococcus sp. IEGM 1414]
MAVVNGSTTHLLGPDPQAQPVELPTEQAQRQLQSVLDEPDSLAATERIAGFRKAHDSTAVAGHTNSGLFASYHLTQNVPQRPDWVDLNQAGARLLSDRGQKLIGALGFKTKPATGGAVLLSTATDASRAVAVLLDDTEQFDSKSPRFQLSPVAYGLAVAAQQEVPWLLVLRKDQIRLYPGRDGVGVGSKGQAETYFEIDLSTVDAEYAGLLPLIFTADALAAGGTTDQLLDESARYATELGKRLRERVYDEIVPSLAVEVARQLANAGGIRLDADGLVVAYRVTLRILFRLLFQAYAEDRGLLPSGRNEGFDANSLKTNARRLLAANGDAFGNSTTIWFDLVQAWDAIDKGNIQWQVPAYNGGLFSSNPERSSDGALFTKIQLPDKVLGPALKHLLVDTTSDGVEGPVDFRSLSVREFGTIYEGLLESSLSLAEQDLTVDLKGAWVPAKASDEPHVRAGGIYFHSASGERKATGSYFTPKVVVDHLIERSVVPALTTHLDKIAIHLANGDAVAAARDFFDFRAADLAMGSGHFLVAAVDKIEALMRTFLAQHAVPGVTDELLRLADAAKDALGSDDFAKSEVDEIGLLRRQVARRCIYGLDINPMAVELARLALWIHTFVPGLPMSNLDHGLVNANSLTGMGSVDEALDVLQSDRKPGQEGFFDGVITDTLADAKTLLTDLAAAGEANKAEVEESARILDRARDAAAPAQRIFDVAVAARVGAIRPNLLFTEDDVREMARKPEVTETVNLLQPAHLPVLFPEVFLRTNPGFDVLLGNPPWEKLKVEERIWWAVRLPGLARGMTQAERVPALTAFRAKRPDLVAEYETEVATVSAMNKVIKSGPFELGGGDTDLYQAFAWRNWQLVRESGRIALVLPRGALSGSGMVPWRKSILKYGTFVDVCFAINNGGWLFPSVHGSYTVGLTVVEKSRFAADEPVVSWAGPFASEKAFRQNAHKLARVPATEFQEWSAGAVFPLIPDATSAEVFRTMRLSPTFGQARSDFQFQPVAELHASGDKAIYEFDVDEARGRTPVFAGASFNIWNPDASTPYAYSQPEVLRAHLAGKLRRSSRSARSAYVGTVFDEGKLPIDKARIAFRDVTSPTNTRTMIACLLPPGASAVHKAPLLVRRAGDARSEAALLGIMSSVPFDWSARRWVELTMSFQLLSALPVPIYDPTSPLTQRVVEISGRLSAVDGRYADWASEVGVPIGSVKTQADKDDLVSELDALVSLLYGLTEDQVEHIFFTFHRGWKYQTRLKTVLEHYAGWKGQS